MTTTTVANLARRAKSQCPTSENKEDYNELFSARLNILRRGLFSVLSLALDSKGSSIWLEKEKNRQKTPKDKATCRGESWPRTENWTGSRSVPIFFLAQNPTTSKCGFSLLTRKTGFDAGWTFGDCQILLQPARDVTYLKGLLFMAALRGDVNGRVYLCSKLSGSAPRFCVCIFFGDICDIVKLN